MSNQFREQADKLVEAMNRFLINQDDEMLLIDAIYDYRMFKQAYDKQEKQTRIAEADWKLEKHIRSIAGIDLS